MWSFKSLPMIINYFKQRTDFNMKKKLSAILCSVICITSLSFTGYAAEDNYYTLEEAITYAFENDYNLKSLESTVTKAEKNAVQEESNRRNYRDAFSMGEFTMDTGFAAALYSKGYMLDTAQMQLRIAQRNLQQGKNDLENNVKQGFYGYIVSQKTTDNAQRSLDKAKEQKSVAEVRYNQGQITKSDLQSFELNVKKAENTLKEQQRSLQLSMLSLKNTMSYPTDKELIPVGEVELCEADATSLETATELAKTHNNMLNLQDVYESAKKRYDIAMGWYSTAQINYYIEKATWESAKNDYYKNKNSYELNVMSRYNAMQSAYETLDYLNDSLEIVKNQAEIAEIRYDMGQITSNDYISYTNQVYELESTIEQAKLGAILSVYNYRMTFTSNN